MTVCRTAFGKAGWFAALLPLAVAGAQADDGLGCADLFARGKTVTLTGKTVAGKKNTSPDAVTLSLTAGPVAGAGVPIAAGRIAASRLGGGAVAWQAAPKSRWGNRCMEVVAPDGWRRSFLALTWEDDNAHPNLHAVVARSGGTAMVVGFLDTKDGAFHEAQVILGAPAADTVAAATSPAPGDAGSLCRAIFGRDEGHFFVGTGYATAPGTNPGYLELHLKPASDTADPIPLGGEFIATEDPNGANRHAIDPGRSACIDLADPRYAVLRLTAKDGAEMVLWLWGKDGVPQHRDRLMGYLTLPGTKIVHGKVALWRL